MVHVGECDGRRPAANSSVWMERQTQGGSAMDTVKSSPLGEPSREDRGKSKMIVDSGETDILTGQKKVSFTAFLDNAGVGKASGRLGNRHLFRV